MHHRRADSESVVFVPMISKFPEVETTLHFAHKDSISYHNRPAFWQVSTLNSWLQYGSNANITNTIWRLLSHGQLKKLQCGHHKEGSWCWDRTTSCSFYTLLMIPDTLTVLRYIIQHSWLKNPLLPSIPWCVSYWKRGYQRYYHGFPSLCLLEGSSVAWLNLITLESWIFQCG